jgi:DNA-binding NtrC family response regulator
MGTTFRIYIPRFMGEDEKAVKSEPVHRSSGAGSILLVEDDTAVRDMTMAMLQYLGYTVHVAATPLEALAIRKKNEIPLDLMITDVVMAEIKGPDLKIIIEEIRPGIKVLFMSGYTGNIIMRHGVADENLEFLQKPFTINDLAQKVSDIIGKAAEQDPHVADRLPNMGR